MVNRICAVQALDDYILEADFYNGETRWFDVKKLFSAVPKFRILKKEKHLFHRVKVEDEGCAVSWDDELKLDADVIWADGVVLERCKKADISHLLAYQMLLARHKSGMTQKELAARSGIYQADISKLERGLGNPSLSTLKRLADAMGMELKIGFDFSVPFQHRTLEERAKGYEGNLNLDGEYDWGEPVGREVW